MNGVEKIAPGWDEKMTAVLALKNKDYEDKSFWDCETVMALGDLKNGERCFIWEVYDHFPELLEKQKIKRWNMSYWKNDKLVGKECAICNGLGYSDLITKDIGDPTDVEYEFGHKKLWHLKHKIRYFYNKKAPAFIEHLKKDHGINLDKPGRVKKK